VGDDEGGSALHQEVEAALDQGFGLGVERTGGLVQDQDARVGEDGAGDGEPLTLAAGELDAAFADDGFVPVGEALGELVDAGDAAGFEELGFGGVWPGKQDVLANGSIKEEGLLQNDA
jgi:hypothetical protein